MNIQVWGSYKLRVTSYELQEKEKTKAFSNKLYFCIFLNTKITDPTRETLRSRKIQVANIESIWIIQNHRVRKIHFF